MEVNRVAHMPDGWSHGFIPPRLSPQIKARFFEFAEQDRGKARARRIAMTETGLCATWVSGVTREWPRAKRVSVRLT
jgi:hypothetical protein